MTVTATDATADAYRSFLDDLIAHRLLIPSGVPGVYGRGGVFEDIVERFERFITAMGGDDDREVMRFPPVLNRRHYERTDHLGSFPNLLGSVHSFDGDDRAHRALLAKLEENGDWAEGLAATDVVLIPAACYPLYPTATGELPPGGRLVDLRSFVFRHEPSPDPARMQCFRQREYVRLGTPDAALAHRDFWMDRALHMLQEVGLDADLVPANDPFFGRGGQILAATQREQALKFELTFPICSTEQPTAVVSCNYHLDHFGIPFEIRTPDGKPAHTACVGFGLERIALALLKTHGFDPGRWPTSVRRTLDA